MRKPSQNDYQIFNAVIAAQEDGRTYSGAVRYVAETREYKVPSVYGIMDRVKKWEKKPADEPQTPMDVMPEGQALKGVSSYVDQDGNILRQWIKTDREQESWRTLIDAALLQARALQPLMPIRFDASLKQDGSLAVYPIADWHVGLRAALERGWTLQQSLDTFRHTFLRLVDATQRSERCVVAFLGDFTHNDNDTNTTPRSGKKLDVSAPYAEIVQAAFQLSVDVIKIAAQAHKSVEVVYLAGNHDESTGIVMQAALANLFANSPQVYVHNSGRFQYLLAGTTLLGFTHGHTIKREELPMIMATDQPIMWGMATTRVWHTGHIHHRTLQEYRGCVVESHASPAPRDAWHEGQGYRSQRSMVSVVYDDSGEVARHTVSLN